MKRTIGFFLFAVVLSLSMSAQKLSPKDRIKMQEADNAFYAKYYEEAIKLYKSVYNKNMTNPVVNYRLGFCYLYLGDFQDALDYFEAVSDGGLKKKHSEYYFGHGLAFQRLGKFDEALEKYKDFKQKGRPKDQTYYEVDNHILQCNFALTAIDAPVSVTVENVGDSINSKYDDYHPSVSADGKKFIFTSRREDSKGGVQLVDGQYYEDVYESKWNEEQEMWGESKPVEGALNSDEYDANCSITPDGQGILVYRNISEENKKVISPTGGGDIYLSTIGSTGRWSAPKLVEGVNSKAMDAGACLTVDGNTMYFISNRIGIATGRGAQGGKDIWVTTKQEDGTWGKPQNLGEAINTPGDESAVFIHPNGNTLFFSSEGHHDKNMGGFDVFRSEFKDGKWSAPENLGYPINSHRDEKEIVISTDGEVAWLTTIREEGKKDFDIYEVDLKHYNVLTGESEILSILKGKVVDASTGLPLKAKISVTEKGTENVTELKSGENGDYFNAFASHREYVVRIDLKGYKPFEKIIELNAPKPKKSPKRSSSSRRKKKKTTQTHTVEMNFELERNEPIAVVSKNLFTTQIIAFEVAENDFVLNDFSKNMLEMYAKQYEVAPTINLDVSGHFEESEDANMKSKVLADKVVSFLVSKGVDAKAIKVHYLGDTEPIASNETITGKAANRRVEIRIVL